jgi:iron complex outermembrane receptor protein
MKWCQRLAIRRTASCLLVVCATIMMMAGVLSAGETAPDGRDLKTLSIEELMTIEVQTVTSTSKYRQKVTEAPSSVTIITADEIRKYGYRTLADILKSVRGFFVTYDRNTSYVGVRGFARPGDFNTRILLMVDGHRMNDNVYDKASIGNEFILDVDLIDRVEISRGPSSSLYGSNAFFAVVNIITRKGKDVNGAEVSGEAASFGTDKGRVSFGKKWQDGSEALISGTGYDSRGDRLYFPEYDPGNPFHDPRARNNGIADYRDGERFASAFTKWSSQGFTLEGALISREKGIPTAAKGSDFNDPGNRVTDERAYGDVTYDHRIGQQTDVTARVYYDSSIYSADYVYSGIVNRDSSFGTWLGGELKLSTKLCDIHRFVLGAEYDDNRRQDQRNADQNPFIQYLNDERSSRTWATYIQDEVTFSPNVILNAGVRYDETSFSGSTTNPRIALIFNPAAGSTVKLLYGTAFRSPNVHELYYQSSASSPPIISNPDLKPEKIRTSEIVYEQYFGHGLRTTVDGYYYTIDDLINQTLDPSGRLVFQNIEEVEARGLEFELEKRWAGGASGRLNYALQRATNSRTGDVLTNSPEQLAQLNVMVPFLTERLFAGLEEQYTSRRKTDSGKYIGDIWLTNLTLLGRNATRTVEVSVSVYNLLNTNVSDPATPDLAPLNAVCQDGRTVRVKLTYAF